VSSESFVTVAEFLASRGQPKNTKHKKNAYKPVKIINME
jgi:hypothetical protein